MEKISSCHQVAHQDQHQIVLPKHAQTSKIKVGSKNQKRSATKSSRRRKKNAKDTCNEKEILALTSADISASSCSDGSLKDTYIQGGQAPVLNVDPGENTLCEACLEAGHSDGTRKNQVAQKEIGKLSKEEASGQNGLQRLKSSSVQAFSEKSIEKRPLFQPYCVPDTHKRRKTSADEAEGPLSSNKSTPKKNEDKQPMCLSLNVCEMMKRKFWPPKLEDTFTFSVKSDGPNLHALCTKEVISITNMYTQPDGNTIYISWENQAVQEITRLANLGHDSLQELFKIIAKTVTLPSGSNVTIFKNGDFQQYARTVCYLIHRKREQMNAVKQQNKKKTTQKQEDYFLQIGKYVLKLQSDDLYVVPQYTLETNGHHKTIDFNERNLSYVKLRPTNMFNKKYSETLYNCITGNHRKVSCTVRSPEDAVAVGAVLFSEVIRNPEMFFHNIVLIHPLKSWDDFRLHHPMVTGGSWKLQADSEKLPKKSQRKSRKILKHSCKSALLRKA